MSICSRSRIALASITASALVLSCTAGVGVAATSSASSLESQAVREEIAKQVLQTSGPAVATAGTSGGTSEPAAPAGGELVPSLTTAYGDTWRIARRPLVTRVYSSPVNYKTSAGSWHPIEDQLIPAPMGGYENAANSFSLEIPSSPSSPTSLSFEGRSLSFSLIGASMALASSSGDAASYGEVLPETDLSYLSRTSGVQETATLTGTGAPAELRYELSASAGLSPREEPDGAIAFVDEAGAVEFTIPAAVALRPGAAADSARTLPSTLTPSGSDWVLSVDTDEPWLREMLQSGEVAVDPSVEVSGTQECSITEETPKSGYCASGEFQVGYDSTHKEHHGLEEFGLSALPSTALVLNAKLGLYVQAESTTNKKAVGVYRVEKPWTTSATWETYDGTHAWTHAGGDYANPLENSDASVNPSVGGSTGWYYWYPTKMVQEWVNSSTSEEGEPNDGLIVKDQTDNETQNLLTIASSNASSDKPYIEVSWEPRGQGTEPQYTTIPTALTDRSKMDVNVASGDLMIEADDLNISGVAGFGFSSTRTWNSLNAEEQEYARWSDSNANESILVRLADGSIAFENATGAWFTFIKQSSGSFITPPGIKAVLCEGAKCSESLPSGVKYRLTYEQSQEHLDYNEEGVSPDRKDRFGNQISREFPSYDHEVYTDTHGHKIEELINSETWLTEVKDLSGSRATKYAYESNEDGPELTSYTDANGKVTKYGYQGELLTSITDPVGNVTKFQYDSHRRITEIIRTTNSWHTEGPTTKFIYYEGSEVPSKCEGTPKATLVRDPDWTAEKEHETLYCANVLDEVVKTFDAEGNKTTATYNAFGDQTSTTAASPGGSGSGGATSLIYGEAGVNLNCEISGTTTVASTCPTSRPDNSALVTSFSYKDEHNLYSATQVENPESNSVFACYNEGKQTGSEGPACPTTAKGPAGSLESESDQLTSEHELSFEYNKSNGTIESSTDADGDKTTYEYENGNLKKVTPPSGSGIEPTTITVDADNRPHVITDGAGHVETITYDNDDRITKIEYTGTGTAKTVRFEYDGDGNLQKREDSTGTTKYTVDALNRVTKEELPGSVSNSYEYDAASNLTVFTDGGGTTKYKYNGLNEVAAMTEPGASTATKFAYNHDRQLTQISYPSGAKETYKLEEATGRPETITAEGVTGTSVPKLTYTYKQGEGKEEDDTSLIQTLSESSSGAVTSYAYDKLERLTEALTKTANKARYTFKLDGAGNRLKQTVNLSGESEGEATYYAYNSGNELECRQTVVTPCSGSSATELSHYSYDKGGEETAITPKHDTSGANFAFNAASELSTLTPSGGSEETLTYAGGGQDDLVGVGSTTIQNSLLGLTREVNSSGTSYYARMPNGLLIDERTPSGNFNPLYDAQGDVIALVNTSGKVERTFRYGPFGENVKSEGTQTIPYPFGYKGGYRVAAGNTGSGNVANGILHFGERYYDTTTGRWTQQDPEDQTTSVTQGDRFVFTGADPIDRDDPSGEKSLQKSAEHAATACLYGAGIGAVAGSTADGVGAVPGAIDGCETAAAISLVGETVEEVEELFE